MQYILSCLFSFTANDRCAIVKKENTLNAKYTQAIWDLTEALQEEKQMENALAGCLEIMSDTVGCEGGFVWLSDRETAPSAASSWLTRKKENLMARTFVWQGIWFL